MRQQHVMVAVAVMFCVMVLQNTAVHGFGGNNGTACPRPVGADLIVGDVLSITSNYSSQEIEGEWYDAFSFGYVACNVGNANSQWFILPNNRHPAWAQSLYRLKNSRIEQVGASWVAHKVGLVPANICGCGCSSQSGGFLLGAGCAETEGSGNPGNPLILSPRWQINPHTGFFPPKLANPPYAGSTARRLRAKSTDLEAGNDSVKYFLEYTFISPQDAELGNQNNNASYREVRFHGGPDEFDVSAASALTQRERAAIRAWRASDPSVVETDIQIPAEGLFILAAKATHLSGNTWNYEYALLNMNSDLACRAFSVPLPAGAAITEIGFHDVDYHSGDAVGNFENPNLNISGEDWAVAFVNGSIRWSTQSHAQNVNANALRWGTMYNFRFNANRPPADRGGHIALTTFKGEEIVQAWTAIPGPPACASDISPSNASDGAVNVNDLLAVIGAWGPCPAPPIGCDADVNGDATVNVSDLLSVIDAWGPCE